MTSLGPIGRLGRYTATHFRVVALGWLALGHLAARRLTAGHAPARTPSSHFVYRKASLLASANFCDPTALSIRSVTVGTRTCAAFTASMAGA